MPQKLRRLATILGLVAVAAVVVTAVRRLLASPAEPPPGGHDWPPLAPEQDARPPDEEAVGPHGEVHTLEHDQVVDDAGPHEAAVPGEPPEELGPWVAPVDGACPATHPVKAKAASGIYHVEGGANYERTVPDRCYLSPAAAEADGYRAAKR